MGKTCIDAAQKSVAILTQMSSNGTLSSLTAFDSTCILRLIIIFILAYAHTRLPQYSEQIWSLQNLVASMEQIGFTKMVSEETPLRLAELGIPEQLQDDDGDNQAPIHLSDATIAQLWGNWDP